MFLVYENGVGMDRGNTGPCGERYFDEVGDDKEMR